MKYYNELEQSWRKLKEDRPEEAKAIGENNNREFLEVDTGEWIRDYDDDMEGDGYIYRAPIKEKRPLSFDDIKQGDAIRAKGHKLWSMVDLYSETEIVTLHDRFKMSLLSIMDSYEIRSIGETNWRPCHK